MAQQGVFIRIGAVLTGWHQAIGTVTRDLGKVDEKTKELKHSWFDLARATATMWGTARLVKGAGDLEDSLMEAKLTAELTDDQVKSLQETLNRLSMPDETNQSVQELLTGYKSLVAAGLDHERALAALPKIGRTATAAFSNVEDISKTAFVLMDTLGIMPDQIGKAFDMLTYAGQKGRFELKDMAQYFPMLGAAAKEAGLQGMEGVASLGSALQMAIKGAADPAQAANNFKNYLAKIMSPEAIKNFQERGVNVARIFSDALKSGENPIEALLKKTDEMLGSDLTTRKVRAGQLFGDQQVQDFLKPMLSNMANYKDLKNEILNASGTVDDNYNQRMQVFNMRWQGFSNALANFGEAIGKAFLPPLGLIVAALTPVVAAFAWMSDNTPNLTAGIVTLGTGFMILRPILMFLPAGLSLATIGMKAFGAAMAFASANPIALTLGVIALGIMLLIDLWPKMRSTFEPVITYISDHWRGFAKLLGPVGWAVVALVDNWDVLGSAVGSAIDWMVGGIDWLGEKLVWLKPLIDGIGEVWASIFGSSAAKGIGNAWDRFSMAPEKVKEMNAGLKPGAGLAEAQARGSAQLAGAAPKQAAMNAFSARGGNGADGRVQVEVDFKNLPKGVVATTEANGSGLDVASKTGYALEAFG